MYFVFSTTLLLVACKKKSVLQQNFKCKESFFSNLEEIKDSKENFSVAFPKTWKTNFYTDNLQSSIYTADTLQQLTKSILLDVSFINNDIVLNDVFKLKIEQENLNNKLIQIETKEFSLFNKPSYYVLSKGVKNNFAYQSLQIFISINLRKSMLIKTEIYGDSLTQERLCKAITLIEKIKILA